jgi:hypothetical protein
MQAFGTIGTDPAIGAPKPLEIGRKEPIGDRYYDSVVRITDDRSPFSFMLTSAAQDE